MPAELRAASVVPTTPAEGHRTLESLRFGGTRQCFLVGTSWNGASAGAGPVPTVAAVVPALGADPLVVTICLRRSTARTGKQRSHTLLQAGRRRGAPRGDRWIPS